MIGSKADSIDPNAFDLVPASRLSRPANSFTDGVVLVAIVKVVAIVAGWVVQFSSLCGAYRILMEEEACQKI